MEFSILSALSISERICAMMLIVTLSGLLCYKNYQISILQKKFNDLQQLHSTKLHDDMRFFRQINHVIRTPLNGVLVFLELLKMKIYGDIPDAYHEYSHLCHDSVQELQSILEKFAHYCDISHQQTSPDILRQTAVSDEKDPYVTPKIFNKQNIPA